MHVEFEKIPFNIHSTSDGNGSISPLGDTNVGYGDSETYTFTPNTGYHIADVKIDGVSNPQAVTEGNYTFNNVTGNHTIEVSFAMNTYTVTPSAGTNGSISSYTVQTASNGDNQTYTFTPAKGYKIKDVLVDGVSVGTPESYTFTNITANHTVHVEFEKISDNQNIPDTGDSFSVLSYLLMVILSIATLLIISKKKRCDI